MKNVPAPSRAISLLALAATFAGFAALVRADDWSPNVSTTATWHSNVTNAEQTTDQIDSLELKLDLLSAKRYPMGRDDSLHLTVHLGGDWWPRYDGLTSGAAGGRAEWQHKFGTSALAPTVSLEGSADAIAAKETGRRGVLAGLTLAVRKRFNDLTRGKLSHEVTWLDSRYGTYDRTASETALEVDRDLTDLTRLTFGVRFRDGDIVTYATPPRPDLAALAPNQLDVETFGRPMRAYRIDARTWSARAALVHALDENSAILAAYEWRTTSRGSLSFVNNLVSISLVHQF